MKFDAQEFLDKHSGDALRALKALHRDVEDRESDNFELREEKRKLKTENATLKEQIEAKPTDKLTNPEKDLLSQYQELGSVEELSSLSEQHAEAVDKLFALSIETELRKAGVPEANLAKAAKLVLSDSEEFLSEKDDTVEFDATKFKTEYPMFLIDSKAAEEDDEDSEESEDDSEDLEKLSDESQERQTERIVRVVGGKRNKERTKSDGLSQIAQQVANSTSHLPAVLMNKEQ